MNGTGKGFPFLFFSLCLLITVCGCALPGYRAHSEFEARVRNIRIPMVVLSHVRIYESSPGGVVELRDDWSAVSRRNLLSALLANLKAKHYKVKPPITDKEIEREMEEIQALYKAVNRSIQLHTYGPQLFPEKLRNFN